MPEALAAIPREYLQTGNSSETDGNPNTARSSDDTSTSTSAGADEAGDLKIPLQTSNNGAGKKSRKSNKRSNHKKPQKLNSIQQKQQKTIAAAAAHKLKSHIPRPFQLQLTPSSSATSIVSSSTANSVTTAASLQSSSRGADQSIRYLPAPSQEFLLQRQLSASSLRLHFRLRKSFSQMDFKHARRTGNIHPTSNIPGRNHVRDDSQENQRNNQMNNTKALMPKNIKSPGIAQSGDGPLRNAGLLVTHSQDALVHKILQQDDYYVMMERDPKMAGMRIFATIMLNAWRKRRDEVRRLMEEVTDLKRGSIKAKNQLHVYNTLFRVEQKRNDELSVQLKMSLEDINRTKSSCESLTTSLISLKADKALLEQQMQSKDQEFDGLNTILTQTKSDLFKAMTQQRELQANLSMEQRKVQNLENQKNDLINEICEVNNDALEKEEKLRQAMHEKDMQLTKSNAEIRMLENLLSDFKVKDSQVQEFAAKELEVQEEIKSLQNEIGELKACLADTIGCRLRAYWTNTMVHQKTTVQMLHWIAYYALPATPPPKYSPPASLNFSIFSLEKVLTIIRR